MFYAGISTLNNQLTVLLFGLFHRPIDSGFFMIASRGAEIVLFGLLAVSSTVAPQLAKLYAQKRIKEMQSLISSSSRQLAFYSVGMTVVLVVAAKPLVSFVFGQTYLDAVLPFQVLCLAQMLNGLFGYAGLALNMIGQEKVSMWCMFTGFGMNLVFNLILIPIWGVTGAAVANAMGIVLWKLLAARFLARRFNLRSGPYLLSKGIS